MTEKKRFSLADHPWLFLLVFIIVLLVCIVFFLILFRAILKLPPEAASTQVLVYYSGYGLMIFLIVPFVLGFRRRPGPYIAYLREIRLTRWQPLLRLILLGLSCYLLLALSQFSGTLVFRLSQGLPVDGSFLQFNFPFAGELPPNSWSVLFYAISIAEEVAFRGFVLALFLRFYKAPRAILFSALAFGAMHIFGVVNGNDLAWALGNVVWAAILGLFYGYITVKTGSLLPAMIVHYLGNLFIYPLTAYIQNNASMPEFLLFSITFTMGIIPVLLMSLWARFFASRWLKPAEPAPAGDPAG